jgi:hypothetical protein
MHIAFGIRAHSGWAALVAIGRRHGEFVVADRCRLELVEDLWAKQPYHAAQSLKSTDARALVTRGIAAARRIALEQIRASVERERQRGNAVRACAVLVGRPMPAWSVEEILAVHFRMHKAEGVLFQEVLLRAAGSCGLRPLSLDDAELVTRGTRLLDPSIGPLEQQLTRLGRSVGPPWGRDQKDAALAACVALAESAPGRE